MTSGNPKKMKVSELRAALESRGMSSNGLKTELIQRLELAMDEEEFGSEAQEMEELKVASPKETKKIEPKRKETLAVLAAAAVTMADEESEKIQRERSKHVAPVKKATVAIEGSSSAALSEIKKDEKDRDDAGNKAAGDVLKEMKEEKENKDGESTGKAETDAPVTAMTEEEKRAARAAKFGIPLSIEDKKAQRAKRFDLPSAGTEEEKAKRLKRAERFHLETDDTFEKKKDARMKRFGLNAEEERRLERAKRFNLETSEVFQEKRQKRLERFATAQQ